MENIIFAYLAVIMFGTALVSKGLGVGIVAAVAIMAAGVDETIATFIFVLYIPALLLAAFRE